MAKRSHLHLSCRLFWSCKTLGSYFDSTRFTIKICLLHSPFLASFVNIFVSASVMISIRAAEPDSTACSSSCSVRSSANIPCYASLSSSSQLSKASVLLRKHQQFTVSKEKAVSCTAYWANQLTAATFSRSHEESEAKPESIFSISHDPTFKKSLNRLVVCDVVLHTLSYIVQEQV